MSKGTFLLVASSVDSFELQAGKTIPAGFYLNEDPAAANYDPKLKIIKSLFNGSKGPVTRPVTPVDWDGDENPKRAARFATSSFRAIPSPGS